MLGPGEAVFFPTSWLHETHTLPPPPPPPGAGAIHSHMPGGCSLSLSLQWRYPSPVGFIRDFGPRLMRASETHFCFEHWAPFITGDVDGIRRRAGRVLEAVQSAAGSGSDEASAYRGAEQQLRRDLGAQVGQKRLSMARRARSRPASVSGVHGASLTPVADRSFAAWTAMATV
eukprot:COSAG01_NODE_29671_length_632_cov_1.243902_1_plen_172_part_01